MEKSVKAKIGFGVLGTIVLAGYIYVMWYEPFVMLIGNGVLPLHAFFFVLGVNVLTIVVLVLFIRAMFWCVENLKK